MLKQRVIFHEIFIALIKCVCIYCCLADLQLTGDMEQQIPAISVPMPGKNQQNENKCQQAPILSSATVRPILED